jgi:hypothetical protein
MIDLSLFLKRGVWVARRYFWHGKYVSDRPLAVKKISVVRYIHKSKYLLLRENYNGIDVFWA